MRLVETADGSVAVVELDPAKKYWIIAEKNCGIDWSRVRWVNGMILLKQPGTNIAFVENPDAALSVATADGKPE